MLIKIILLSTIGLIHVLVYRPVFSDLFLKLVHIHVYKVKDVCVAKIVIKTTSPSGFFQKYTKSCSCTVGKLVVFEAAEDVKLF